LDKPVKSDDEKSNEKEIEHKEREVKESSPQPKETKKEGEK